MHLIALFANKIMHSNLLPNHLPNVVSVIFTVSERIRISSRGTFFFFCLYKEKISKENLNAYFKNILLIVIALFQHYYSYVKAIDQCVKPISSVFQVTPR